MNAVSSKRNRFTLRPILHLLLASTLALGTLAGCSQQELINRATGAVVGAGVGLLQAQLITPEQEVQMGDEIRQQIDQEYQLYTASPELVDYVRSVGQKLAAHAQRKDEIQFRFDILDSEELNAFAIPGGGVFITTEALRNMHNEAELAGVLGHEIEHIDQKHALDSMRQVMVAQGLLSGSFAKTDPEVLKNAADLTLGLIIRGFGREQEKEADLLGADLAISQNYDPEGLLGFLETLKEVQGDVPSGIVQFLLSHPGTDERLRLLREHFAQTGVQLEHPIRNTAIFQAKVAVLGPPQTTAAAATANTEG